MEDFSKTTPQHTGEHLRQQDVLVIIFLCKTQLFKEQKCSYQQKQKTFDLNDNVWNVKAGYHSELWGSFWKKQVCLCQISGPSKTCTNETRKNGRKKPKLVLLPVLWLLLIHPLLPLFEQSDGSFGFLHQAVDVDFKVVILTELGQPLVLLIFAQYKTQMLVGIRQNIQDVWWTVFQLESGILAETDLHHPKQQTDNLSLKTVHFNMSIIFYNIIFHHNSKLFRRNKTSIKE